jgi:hypothetical protein
MDLPFIARSAIQAADAVCALSGAMDLHTAARAGTRGHARNLCMVAYTARQSFSLNAHLDFRSAAAPPPTPVAHLVLVSVIAVVL